ncbi:MAG: exodeoxyribonuclease VII small subunit [Anaerolineales bacterium]|nr:exodeoxyribonuclease VII small subunit [Anaerolineales bacterium]
MADSSKQKPVEKLNYEEAFQELERIVSSLEQEQLQLDRAMSLFERGQALSERCARLLDQAELKVKQLSGDEDESRDVQADED